MKKVILISLVSILAFACNQKEKKGKQNLSKKEAIEAADNSFSEIDERLNKYVEVKLTADLSALSENQKKMIPILIEVGKIMDDIFWKQAYGDKSKLLDTLQDEKVKRFVEINYGPWDRLAANEPFVDVLPQGSHPETRSVRGANYCRIAVHRPQNGDIVIILSVIDNLVKGAAGQAVQNMNIMFGFAETAGLDVVPLLP